MRRVAGYVRDGWLVHLLVAVCVAAAGGDAEAQTLYEQWLTADGVVAANYTNTRWIGQSFTALSDHTVSSVSIRIGKDGSPGDITVALMECWTYDFGSGYVIHNPYGVILTSVTMPESYVDTLAPATAMFQFSFPPYALQAGSVYAIVMTSSGLTTTDRYIWADYSWGGYADGQFVTDMNGLWQGTSSGYPDLVFQVYGTATTTVPTDTGRGTAGLSASDGSLESLSAQSVPTLNKPADTAFPDGGFSFQVTGLATGASTVLTYTGPTALPVGTQWWKWDGAGSWTALPVGSDDGDNVITVTVTDNDSLDGDPTGGTLLDPGGPGFEHIVVCDFSGAPTSGPAPLAVSFTDESNQDIDEWQWDFDDNGTVDSSAEAPSHTYVTPGIYDVSLDVTSLGVSDSETKIGFVTVYTPSVAEFSATPTAGMHPLTVDFTDESSGDVSSWEWDFDNDGGVDSTERNPSYTYPGPGSYTVSLTVSGLGGTDTITKDDYVVVEQQEAEAIPLLSGPALLLLVTLLAGAGVWLLRRMG